MIVSLGRAGADPIRALVRRSGATATGRIVLGGGRSGGRSTLDPFLCRPVVAAAGRVLHLVGSIVVATRVVVRTGGSASSDGHDPTAARRNVR